MGKTSVEIQKEDQMVSSTKP